MTRLVTLLLVLAVSSPAAAQSIYWKKDRIYANGKEVASVTPLPSDTTVPSTPTGLGKSNTTPTSVDLSWSGSTDSGGSGLAGYKVYRQKGSGASLPVGTVTGTSFTDEPLEPSTAYTWTIRAFDNAQNHSAASATVSETTASSSGDTTDPGVPTNLRGVATTRQSDYKVRLDWNAVTDAGGSGVAGYEVHRSPLSPTSFSLISGGSPITTLYYEDSTSTANTTFIYKVKAVDGEGNDSDFSSTVNVTTLPELFYYNEFNNPDQAGTGYYYNRSNALQCVPPFGTPNEWYPWIPSYSTNNLNSFNAKVLILSRPSGWGAGMVFWHAGWDGYKIYVGGPLGSQYLILSYWESGVEVEELAWNTVAGPGILTLDATSSTRRIKVYWNGALKIDFTDSNTGHRNSGYIGLTTYWPTSGTGDMLFDNLFVEKQ